MRVSARHSAPSPGGSAAGLVEVVPAGPWRIPGIRGGRGEGQQRGGSGTVRPSGSGLVCCSSLPPPTPFSPPPPPDSPPPPTPHPPARRAVALRRIKNSSGTVRSMGSGMVSSSLLPNPGLTCNPPLPPPPPTPTTTHLHVELWHGSALGLKEDLM
ncbi:unnamed protein product [Closterium sp. NIES-53]